VFFKDLAERGDDHMLYPYRTCELIDIATIMKNVFPKNSLPTNAILNSGDSDFRVDKSVEIFY